MKTILETERMTLREMRQSDFPALCGILQDAEVMYAYGRAFDDAETQAWIDKQLQRYRETGVGLWAAVLKETGEMIGLGGLIVQDCDGEQVLEIGYFLQKAHWHRGYATEAAIACKHYAFGALGAEEVCSIIREDNYASQNVARRNGMAVRKRYIKNNGYNTGVPHLVFSVKNEGVLPCPS